MPPQKANTTAQEKPVDRPPQSSPDILEAQYDTMSPPASASTPRNPRGSAARRWRHHSSVAGTRYRRL